MKLLSLVPAQLADLADPMTIADCFSQPDQDDTPWYGVALVSLGAWLTTLVALALVTAALLALTRTPDGGMVLVTGCIAIALALYLNSRNGLFVQQSATVAALAGQALLVAGLAMVTEDMPGKTFLHQHPFTVMAPASVMVTLLFARWLPLSGLGFLSATGSLLLIATGLDDLDVPHWAELLGLPATLAGAWLLIAPPAGRRWNGTAYALLLADIVIALVLHAEGLGHRHSGNPALADLNAFLLSRLGWPDLLHTAGWLLAGGIALMRLQPALPRPQRGIALALLALLLLVQPGMAAAGTGLLVLGYALVARPLIVLGGLAEIIGLGLFYFQLHVSLLAKSWLLAGIGVVALIGWWWLFRRTEATEPADSIGNAIPDIRPRLFGAPNDAVSQSLGRASAQSLPWRPVLILLTALTIAVSAGQGIMSRETIIAEGRVVLLPLAPVDPRSLIQGDYMRLRLDRKILPARDAQPRLGMARLALDQDGVAQELLTTYAEDSPPPADLDLPDGASSTVDLYYTPQQSRFGRDGQPGYGIDSFFFQEGLQTHYARARFAIIRIDARGRMVLTDLADAERRPLSAIQTEDDAVRPAATAGN